MLATEGGCMKVRGLQNKESEGMYIVYAKQTVTTNYSSTIPSTSNPLNSTFVLN